MQQRTLEPFIGSRSSGKVPIPLGSDWKPYESVRDGVVQTTLDAFFGRPPVQVQQRHGCARRESSSDDDAPLVKRRRFMDDEAVEVSDDSEINDSDEDDDSFVVTDHDSDVGANCVTKRQQAAELRHAVASLRSRRQFLNNAQCPQCHLLMRHVIEFINTLSSFMQ